MTESRAMAPVEQPGRAGLADGIRWSGRSRGGYLGNWWFVQLIRFLGLRIAYLWLVPVAAWFTVSDRQAARCSVDFLRRVLEPWPAWRTPFLVYRHFHSFGVTLLDRLALIMKRSPMRFDFEGEDRFHEHLDQGRGILLLGAHVGGWEMAGHLLGRLGRPVNVVVWERDAEQVRDLLARALEGRQFRVLTADDHPLRSIPILAALRRGEIVAMHGDRAFGGAAVRVPFLGGEAAFPVGGYLLAAMTGAPVFQVFAVRERPRHYRFFTFPPLFLEKERIREGPAALAGHARLYADRLASVARQYPFQWHNFYPFWGDTPVGAPARLAAAAQAESRPA
jgi:predicted LPLAT superfamily acyltransferase